MGQIKFMISLITITIFVIAIINYGIGFADDNNVAVSLANNSDFATLGSDLEGVSKRGFDEFNTSDIGFSESELDSQDFAFRTGGTLKQLGRNSSTVGVYKTLGAIQNTIFGGKDGGFGVVFNAFVFAIGLISLLYAYKTWIGRNPD